MSFGPFIVEMFPRYIWQVGQGVLNDLAAQRETILNVRGFGEV